MDTVYTAAIASLVVMLACVIALATLIVVVQ
jgi:hypothetical protein